MTALWHRLACWWGRHDVTWLGVGNTRACCRCGALINRRPKETP